jgi:hypothetical protein
MDVPILTVISFSSSPARSRPACQFERGRGEAVRGGGPMAGDSGPRRRERAEHAGRSGGSQACAPMVLAVYVQQQRESMLPDHVVQRYADPW